MKQALFITGTGKSGTSVVAKAFFDAGIPMGTLEELSTFDGGGGNPRGVWEHQEVVAINKAILEENQLDWFQTPTHPLILSSKIEKRIKAFVLNQNTSLFCAKDPRFTWTLPLWLPFYDSIHLVICFRNPIGFSQSVYRVLPQLFDKQQVHDPHSLDVWFQMNQQLLTLSQQVDSDFFGFDEPLSLLKAQLEKLIKKQGYPWNEDAFDAFYVPEARHFSNEDSLIKNRQLPRQLLQLWSQLKEQSLLPLDLNRESIIDPDSANNTILSAYQEEIRRLQRESDQLQLRLIHQELLSQQQQSELQLYQRPWIISLLKISREFEKEGRAYEALKDLYFKIKRLRN